ncbi:predicted protein [Histoplasma mississippiense (nom. inval.)]|uniref:predicted protein n=1 Tax=Ajellomyces capsulatus (strain NAm1 / WU24) TaxID=2059318 RepID=UPI000157C387|nr:predicted protein [Histoplasma mississippiense (nom. inval.)]EDN07699.1 predicted protein [Histoplasma mississippiense (nom. inval.)]
MAFQSAPQPLPPTTIHRSSSKTHRISPSVAHDFLSAYLDRAATDPSLQPDSTLSTHGPVSANAGSAPNLVIHNLKRVQAGLAGEDLEIYERAQEVMDVGEGEGEEGDQAQMSMQMQMDTDQGFEAGVGQESGVIDKEERKRKKKERRKEEKRVKSKATTTR